MLENVTVYLNSLGRKDFMGFGMSQSILPLQFYGLLSEGPSHYHSKHSKLFHSFCC
jgi:hypothetical protein